MKAAISETIVEWDDNKNAINDPQIVAKSL